MDNVVSLFQSRLSSKLNKISRRLQDNSTRISGVATDCIRISVKVTDQGDILSRKVEDLDVVSVIFPPLVDVPLKKVKNSSGQTIVIPYMFDAQPFEAFIPSTTLVDTNDLLIKFYDNLQGEDPYVAIMEVKDMLGNYGARGIVYNSYQLTYYDGTLPEKILDWIILMSRRRQELQW